MGSCFSPMTVRRFRAFRRIRRAWWSLWAFAFIFAFTLAAELVCPCDPRAVVDPAELAPYVQAERVRTYDVRTARYSLSDDGEIFDFEGPAEVRAALAHSPLAESGEIASAYDARVTVRTGYRRIFLAPKSPPAVSEGEAVAAAVSFPFHPCPGHPFGLDAAGRDVYARVVHGLRIALVFGLALAFTGLLGGLVIGAVEGYFGGATDLAMQRLTEIWSALPFLYVMIFVGSTLGRGFGVLLVTYALFNWIAVSYYVRAEFLRLRSRPFVDAARVQGFSSLAVMFREVLPNALTPLITLFPFLLMGAIGSLAALDFLGFGLPPMTPSCGELMQEAEQFRGAWWLVVFPAAALFVVMLLAVLIGEGLRDAFDPKPRARLV